MHSLIFRPLVLLTLGVTHYLVYKAGKKSGEKKAEKKSEKK
jgi:hypothetical protein